MNWWRIAGVVLLSLLGPDQAWSEPASTPGAEFVGSETCKRCHIDQYLSWARTPMAQSFELLRAGVRPEGKRNAGLDPDQDYTADPGCLGCHATGYGQAGGFRSEGETPTLMGVGCEACHGPGGGAGYLKVMTLSNKRHALTQMTEHGLVYPLPEGLRCTEMCHNERSPHNPKVDPKYGFDWEARYQTGAGHAHWKLQYDHGPIPHSYFQTVHPDRLEKGPDPR